MAQATSLTVTSKVIAVNVAFCSLNNASLKSVSLAGHEVFRGDPHVQLVSATTAEPHFTQGLQGGVADESLL